MPHRQRTLPHAVLRPVAFALVLGFGCSAQASDETSPWYVGVSQGFTYDSNVLHTTNAHSDTISSTGVLGGIDITPGRQHIFGDLNAQANRHKDFDSLDNTSYSGTAGLDWQTIERLSGTLRYTTNQTLVNFADVSVPAGTKDVQKTQQALASVRFGITSQFGLEGSVDHRKVDFSAAEDRRAFTARSGSAGVRWGGTGIVTLGVSLRETKTDTPQTVITIIPGDPTAIPPVLDTLIYGPDKADRRDVDFTGTWTPSGLSTLAVRISSTRETHSQPTIPKLSGITGSLSWDYKPTGKLAFKTTISRDTAAETTFSGLPLTVLPVRADNNRLDTALSAEAHYEATAKILVDATLKYGHGLYDVINSNGSNRSTTNYGIGAKYLATRTLTFACNLSQERRSHVYDDTLASCSAQFVLR
jgi:hypothetical protein